jgi:hypothetical protein
MLDIKSLNDDPHIYHIYDEYLSIYCNFKSTPGNPPPSDKAEMKIAFGFLNIHRSDIWIFYNYSSKSISFGIEKYRAKNYNGTITVVNPKVSKEISRYFYEVSADKVLDTDMSTALKEEIIFSINKFK